MPGLPVPTLTSSAPNMKYLRVFGRLLLFLLASISVASASMKPEEFQAKVEKSITVGMSADQVREFFRTENLKFSEFKKPKAISAYFEYNKTMLGFKSIVAAVYLDENDRVSRVVFTKDNTGL